MSENNNDFGAFVAGFVIGSLVGAATALVLAPQSGEETRSQLADKSREIRDLSEERIHHYRDVADNYTQDYRDKAGNVMDRVNTTANRLSETGEQIQNRARIVLDSGKERAEQVKKQVNTLMHQGDSDANQPSDGDTAAAA